MVPSADRRQLYGKINVKWRRCDGKIKVETNLLSLPFPFG